MSENHEKTFILIKPDGVQRGFIGRVISKFEDKGFQLLALKMIWVSYFIGDFMILCTKIFLIFSLKKKWCPSIILSILKSHFFKQI